MSDNFWFRLLGDGNQIWPRFPRSESSSQVRDNSQTLLEEFAFYSSLGAVSLAFGLWVPQAIPNGEFGISPGHFLAVAGQLGIFEAVNQSGLLAFFVLVFFMAGGVDIWLRTIEVAGLKGSFHTLGLWLGTLALYWPTTLIAVLGISDIMVLSISLFPRSEIVVVQNTFLLWYRVALGAITLLIAVSRSRPISWVSSPHRTLRFGLATIALLVLLSFVVQAFDQIIGIKQFIPLIVVGILVVSALGLFYRPLPGLRDGNLDPLEARLIASSSLGLAPLLFSHRIDSIAWSKEGYADLTVKNVGFSPAPLRLRTQIVGSEDEVAFETISRAHAQLRGPIDFVVTDLRTAIKIMGAYNARKDKDEIGYRILCVVASIPWQRVDVSGGGSVHGIDRMVLDAGYLRYTSVFDEVVDPEHPCIPARHRCRPTSLPTVAYYAANHTGDVSEVFITEPYYTWLARLSNMDGHSKIQLKKERLVTYVLLARHKSGTVPAVPYNWRRTICEMIDEGQRAAQENQGVVNHAQLHTLHGFLEEAINHEIELHLEDIHLALCRCRFEPVFLSEKTIETKLSIWELNANDYITRVMMDQLEKRIDDGENPGEILRQAIVAAKPQVTYDEATSDERFFSRFYRQESKPIEDNVLAYLHSLALVAVPDRPGQLARILDALNGEALPSQVDLTLITSTNLGDSALVYMLNRAELPDGNSLGADTVGKPLKRSPEQSNWIEALRHRGFDVIEIKAFMVPLEHAPGSLLSVIRIFADTNNGSRINLEQVFAFPIDETRAVALLVTQSHDWERTYSMLVEKSTHTQQKASLPQESQCDQVELERYLPTKRHGQQVVFNIKLEPNVEASFVCKGLSTWTPTWGSIDSWTAEVGFNSVRLKIPTSLSWLITGVGWVGSVPLIGAPVRQILQTRIPGIAGLDAYKDKEHWWIVMKEREKEIAR